MAKKLVSMKLPPRDKTTEEKMYPTMAGADDEPAYPYGLCLNLDEQQIAPLGLEKLPDTDDGLAVTAKAHVTRKMEEQTQGGGARRSLSLQITHLGLEKPSDKDGDE